MFEQKEGELCPLLKKDCVKRRCKFWQNLRGVHPQTGEPVADEWDCAINWIPVLLIENSQMTRQTGAAVESFRNEVVKGNQAFLGLIQQARLSNEQG